MSRKPTKKQQISRLQKELSREQKNIERYERGVESLAHTRYNAIENVEKQLRTFQEKGYITKKGTIRKNIRADKLQELNNYFAGTFRNDESAYSKVKTRKSRTQTKKHIARNLAEKWDESEKDVKRYIQNITALQNNALMDKLGLDSNQVRILTETYEDVTPETLVEVAEYLIADKEKNTPSLMQQYIGEDDFFEAMTDLVERVENLSERLQHESIEQILEDEGLFDD